MGYATPGAAQDVGVVSVQQPMTNACGISAQDLVVGVQNFGTTAVANIPVRAVVSGATTATVTATIVGPVTAGQTVTATVGTIDTFDGGAITVNATTNLTGDTTPGNDAFSANLSISPGRVPIVNNGPRCPGSPATIMTGMEPAAQYAWYANQTGGTPLGQGATFTTPPLTSNQVYWVQRLNNRATAGIADNTAWSGSTLSPNICNTNGAYGLQFNVTRAVTLTSVTIYPSGAGNITIRLLSGLDVNCNGSATLQTATAVSNGTGPLTVQLNFPLAPGSGYILDAFGSGPSLFRIFPFSAQGYPLNSSDGSVVITGQTFNFTNDYYYFFFNWQLGSEGCDDERTRVPLTIDANACLADVELMVSGPPTTFRGGSVTVDSRLENLGPDTASQLTLTGTAPAGIVFQSNTGACTTGFPCALGDTPPGPALNVASTWSVPSTYTGASPLTINMSASALETDPDGANNVSRSVDVLIVDPVDLSVTVAGGAEAPGGQPYEYTVTVQNAGPGTAISTVLSLPLDALFAGATTTGCLNDPGGVPSCDLGNIAPNTSRTVRVRASSGPTTTGRAALQATVASLSPETNTANDSASASVDLVLFTDFSLQAGVMPNPVVPGSDSVIFTLDLTNGGPSASTGAVITSTIPSELTGLRTTGCDEDPNGLPQCTVSSVLPSGSVTRVTIEGQIAPDVEGSGQASFVATTANRDADPSNNAQSLTLAFTPQADLAMSILPPLEDIVAGQGVTFQVRPFNLGPSVARNVQYLITVPPALEGARTQGCAEDPAGVPVCTLGDVFPDQRLPVFTVSASVAASGVGEFTTTFETRSDTTDPLPNNNISEVTLVATEISEIRPTLMASSDTVASGREVDFTLRIEAGPSDARGVVASFTLPDELIVVSSQGCTNEPSGRTPRCNVGVASGATPTEIVLTARAQQVFQAVTRQVSVTVETTTGGNDPSDDAAELTIQVTPPRDVDLRVETALTPADAMAGDTVAFTVTVRNGGPGNAGDVTLELSLPPRTSTVAVEGCLTRLSPELRCNVGSVLADSGTQARFEVALPDDAEGDQVFGAAIVSASGDETNPGDESSESVITLAVMSPDAGVVDSGPMGGGGDDDGGDDGGCSCSAAELRAAPGTPYLSLLALLLWPLLRRRRG